MKLSKQYNIIISYPNTLIIIMNILDSLDNALLEISITCTNFARVERKIHQRNKLKENLQKSKSDETGRFMMLYFVIQKFLL